MKVFLKSFISPLLVLLLITCSGSSASDKEELEKAIDDWVSARALQADGSLFVLTKTENPSYSFYALNEYKVGPWRSQEIEITDLDKIRGYSRVVQVAVPAVRYRKRHMFSDKGWSPWSGWEDIQGEHYVTNGFSGNGVIKFVKGNNGWAVVDNGGWGSFVWPPPKGWDDRPMSKSSKSLNPSPAATQTYSPKANNTALSDVWVFPNSSSVKLTKEDLSTISRDALWRARNEIYARHGLIFTSKRGEQFVKSLGSAYKGTEKDQEKVYAKMNVIERENIRLIKNHEN